MPQFAIIGDHFGVREDVPRIKLSTAFLAAESDNVTYHNGVLQRLPGRGAEFTDADGDSVVIPDGNPIIHWHYHADPAGLQYCFAYTKAHVYLWDNVAKAWDLMFICSADCTHWSSASFKDKIISVNGVDYVQVWDEDTPATLFASLGSSAGIDIGSGVMLTTAAYVIVYETYLHLLDVTEGGVHYRYRTRWCSRNDETDFDDTGAGDTGHKDLEAGLRIKGAAIYTAGSASMLLIFTNRNITAAALVDDALVFRFDEIAGSRGAVAPDSIVNDPEGNVYYLGTDWVIHRVFSDERISDAIDTTLRGINRTYAPYVRAAYIESLDQLWWAIPKDSASTGNDKVVRLNRRTGGWEPSSNVMDISSFGRYAQQTALSIDDIDTPIDEYDHVIDSVENAEGWAYDVVGDYSGYGWRVADESTDKGNSYTGSAVFSTDLTNGASLNTYKRTEGVWLWFTAESASASEVSVAVRTETEDGFTNYGTVNLYSTKRSIMVWLAIDVRGVQFDVQISGSNPWALEGAIFQFSFDGSA